MSASRRASESERLVQDEVHHELGVALGEPVEVGGDEARGEHLGGAHPHGAGDALIAADQLAFEGVGFFLHALGVPEEVQARRGHHVAVGGAVKEPRADLGFERGEPAAHGGGVDPQRRRGPCERVRAMDGQKVSQIVPIEHRWRGLYHLVGVARRARRMLLRSCAGRVGVGVLGCRAWTLNTHPLPTLRALRRSPTLCARA